MKKVLKKLALLPLFCGLLVTSSCNSDNDNEDTNQLVGTTWFIRDWRLGPNLQAIHFFQVIRFTSTTEFEYWNEDGNGVRTQTFNGGTYTLNYPNVRISHGNALLNGDWTFSSSARLYRVGGSPHSNPRDVFMRR